MNGVYVCVCVCRSSSKNKHLSIQTNKYIKKLRAPNNLVETWQEKYLECQNIGKYPEEQIVQQSKLWDPV